MNLAGTLPNGARLIAVLGGVPSVDGVPQIGPELLTVPFQTVGDNVLLGAESASGFFPRRKELDRRARELLETVGLSVAPATPILELDPVEQRIVELARALAKRPTAILIDDRSTALGVEDARRWYAAVTRAAAVTPVLVAVVALADLVEASVSIDAVMVVRGGAIAGTAAPTESIRLLDLLVGDADEPAAADRVLGPVVLEVRGITVTDPVHRRRPVVEDASLTVRAGEIVGLAGAEAFVLGVFGASSGGAVTGEIDLDGVAADLTSVDKAIAARVLFISEHPPIYDVGLIGGIPTCVSGESLARLARTGLIDPRRNYVPRRAPSMLDALPGARSRPSTADMNEVLAGWAATPPRVALITEPFSGLGPADRAERRSLIDAIAAAGAAVIIEAADAAQLVGLSTRIRVQRGTRLADELPREDASLRGLARLSIRTELQR